MVTRYQHKRRHNHMFIRLIRIHARNYIFNSNASFHSSYIYIMVRIFAEHIFYACIIRIRCMFSSMSHKHKSPAAHFILEGFPQCFCNIHIILIACKKCICCLNRLKLRFVFCDILLHAVVLYAVKYMCRKHSNLRFHILKCVLRAKCVNTLPLLHSFSYYCT